MLNNECIIHQFQGVIRSFQNFLRHGSFPNGFFYSRQHIAQKNYMSPLRVTNCQTQTPQLDLSEEVMRI